MLVGVATPAPLYDTLAIIVGHVVDRGLLHAQAGQPLGGPSRSDADVAVVKLPIGDVVQQGRQFHDVQIHLFAAADVQRELSDAVDVPPIVPRGIVAQQFAHVRFRLPQHLSSIGNAGAHPVGPSW